MEQKTLRWNRLFSLNQTGAALPLPCRLVATDIIEDNSSEGGLPLMPPDIDSTSPGDGPAA